MTEFLLVFAAALLPLYLVIPLLGQMFDVGHQAEMSARYVAFEPTSHAEEPGRWRNLDSLQAEVRKRFFSRPSDVLRTLEDQQAGAVADGPWRSINGLPLLGDGAIGVTLGTGLEADGASLAEGRLPTVDAYAGDMTVAAGFDLRPQGLLLNQVKVGFQNVTLPGLGELWRDFAAAPPGLRRGLAVLTGDWSGTSPDDVQRRVAMDFDLRPVNYSIGDWMKAGEVVPQVESPGAVPGPNVGAQWWSDAVPITRFK